MRPTPCDCPSAGFCPRHRCEKSAAGHQLCQTRPDYFQLWEDGRGPGQTKTFPVPLVRDCGHRGQELREEPCPSCRSRVLIKVFGCALHECCTLARSVVALPCCRTCTDFTPTPEAKSLSSGE
jgi:hypothetical protein